MLDPFTSLSLAAAIVQFVDFGSKLVVEGYGAYKSSEGAAKEDINTQTLAKDLETLCEQLAKSPPSNAPQYSRDEAQLQSIARKCQELSKDLFSLLKALQIDSTGPMRGWDALRQVVKRTWKRGKIEKLQKELGNLRAQVNTHLLAIVRWVQSTPANYQSSAMSSLAHLAKRNEELHVETETQLGQMRSSLLAAVQDQERAIKALETTKAYRRDAYAQALTSYESTLSNLSLRLDALIKGGGSVAKSQRILESLMFAEMPQRHSAIREAYSETFEWIFRDDSTAFKQWLSSESGIFWASGKAGSGKSTLMKFLSDHPESETILSQWASVDKKRLICASFYFWNSGTPIERTQEGLLQSLLFQVLRKCPHLVPVILPERWATDEFSHLYPRSWTRAELSSALARILKIKDDEMSAKFCFFIDGLDEYEGDRYQLVNDLKALSQSSSVKLCVSSRPWTEFKDAFGGNRERMLVLQDLTRGDMDRFVRGMLERDERFVRMAKEEPAAQRFTEQILDKAQGVFLWVFLVVRSLLRGLDNHDDIAILEERLNRLPSKLEEYFARILDSIEDVYQDHAARMLHLMVRAAPLPLTAFWYMPREMKDPDYILRQRFMTPVSDAEAVEHRTRAEHSINAWCRDLLEVRDERPVLAHSSDQVALLLPKVVFLHRTVKDFLLLRDVQESLDARIKSDFSPWLSLVRIHLFVAKSLFVRRDFAPEIQHFFDVAGQVMSFAKKCEQNTKSSPIALIDELDSVGNYLREVDNNNGTPRSHWTNACRPINSNFMAYAVSFELDLYIRHAFARQPRLMERTRGTLLNFALQSRTSHIDGHHIQKPSLAVVQALLECGADPNHVSSHWSDLSNATPWTRFLRRCNDGTEEAPLWPVARLLLLYGANPFECVKTGFDSTYVDCSECLRRCCPPKERIELERILRDARSRDWKGYVGSVWSRLVAVWK